MGACNCNLNSTKNELENEIRQQDILNECQSQENFNNQKKREKSQKIEKENLEKKRGRNALIVQDDCNQHQDNVSFETENTISSADIVEIKKTLKRHFIFSQLSQKEIQYFLKQMKPCVAKEKSYIFKQGDKSSSYYIILDGTCQIQINNQKKKTITFGDSFGDLGIIYSAQRSASVYALTQCYLIHIGRKVFKRVMDDLNTLHEKQNVKFLEVLSFFKDLNEEQRNALGSSCITQTYQEGQTIFNIGDDANSFYVIKQGIVKIVQKDQQIHQMNCFGENSLLVQGGTRSNTLQAKTKCKILSMSRQSVKVCLGDNINTVLKKNLIWNIVEQSKLFKSKIDLKWKQARQNLQFIPFKKGDLLFRKNNQIKNQVYILLNSEIKGETTNCLPNSIVQQQLLLENKSVKIQENMKAVSDGFMGKLEMSLIPENDGNELTGTLQPNNSGISNLQSAPTNGKVDFHKMEKKMQLADFFVVRKLRQGNFGKVYACWNPKTQKLYALKLLDRAQIEKSQIIQYVINEEQILRTIPKFPFIVRFYKLIRDSSYIYFIMDLVEGEDLFDVISSNGIFSYCQTKFLISQILLSIEHMHNNRVIYRDLKPENLMMNPNGYLTMVDMGTAKRLKIEKRYRTNTIIGTPHYMAPEIMTGKGYSFPADYWSLGVMTYELLCGRLPYGQNSEDPFAIYEEIINTNLKFPRNCNKTCKNFIEKLLYKNPQQRIANGFDQLKNHQFFENLDWNSIMNQTQPSFYSASPKLRITKDQINKAMSNDKNIATNFFSQKIEG